MRNFNLSPVFIACLTIFFLFCSTFCFSQDVKPEVPRFEKSECPLPIPTAEKNLECGYLVVRENRSAKNDKTIRLPVIILKSESQTPRPDPVVRTLGGPGVSSLRLIGGRRFSPWLKDRDMIIFEQRGTKYAQPALECPEVNEANSSSVRQRLREEEKNKREIEAARKCYERLKKSGIDLSAYNSAESAADIEDLRRALQLEKINLYGVSYSARLMLNVIRDHPAGIRSVVIESTLPPEVNYDEVGVDGIKRTLDVLFSNCAGDAACAKSFPDLERDFYETVKKLNAKPVLIKVKENKTNENIEVEITGNDVITWAVDYLLSSDTEFIVAAPFEINKVTKGDLTPLQSYAADKLGPSSNALGMRYSVWCAEEMPFEDKRKIAAQSALYPQLAGYEVQSLPRICRVWKVERAKPAENEPVKSDLPVFIIAGEYDAYTPPEWGRLAAKGLKNSFFIELPWVAHGPGFSAPQCFREGVADFFDDPGRAPDVQACTEKMRRTFKFKTSEK